MAVATHAPALFGLDGELVTIRVTVDPRHLEDLLETLAGLAFPVNPELTHHTGSVTVQFPAYRTHADDVSAALGDAGFDPQSVRVLNVWEQFAAAPAGEAMR